MVLLNSTTKKGVLFELNNCFWCFSVTTITMDNAKRKTQIENIHVQVARAFLSKLSLAIQNNSHE